MSHRRRLLAHVNAMSDYFRDPLLGMEFRESVGLSIMGLAIAVDVGNERYASRVEERCRRRGLLVTSQETKVLLLPALNLDERTARRGLDILEAAA
jgi:4-aminobutyrate aminotransferase-like enzyme